MSHGVLFCNSGPEVVAALSAVSVTAYVRELWAHTSLSRSLHCGRTVKAAAEQQTHSSLTSLVPARPDPVEATLSLRTYFPLSGHTKASNPAAWRGRRKENFWPRDRFVYWWYIYFNLIPFNLGRRTWLSREDGTATPFLRVVFERGCPTSCER